MPSSLKPNMGASFYEGGPTFSVWAPFASQVFIRLEWIQPGFSELE